MNEGDEVDWLTQEQFRNRYPPEEGMSEGRGTHVLGTRGKKPTYYDTARTGGVALDIYFMKYEAKYNSFRV